MVELKEQLKTLLRKAVTNAKDGDDENGRWVTIKGTHVFIPDGKEVEDVMREKGWLSDGKEERKKEEGSTHRFFTKDRLREDKPETKEEGKAEDEDDIDSELITLDVADKPTKEAQKAIDEDRQKNQRIAEEHKKEYEKSKDIDLTKLKLDNPSEGKKVQFESYYSGIGKLSEDSPDFDKKYQKIDKKLHEKLKAVKQKYEDKKKEKNVHPAEFLAIDLTEKRVKSEIEQLKIIRELREKKQQKGNVKKTEIKELYKLLKKERESIDNDKLINGLSEIINNCKPETEQDIKILKGLADILEKEEE